MDWPTIIGVACALVLLLGIAARAHYVYWVRRLRVPVDYAERHDLRTDDGVPITLFRLEAPPTPAEPPVLLVHGVAVNHRNVDAEPSLARHLHALGRDVWLLTLRSGQAGLTTSERAKVDFAAMVTHDLPAAIGFVRERTRSGAIDYVGFSMGGILLYAALGRTVARDEVARVAMIGSPARVQPPLRFLKVFRFLPRFVFRAVWLRVASRMSAWLVEYIRTPVHRHIYNPENVGRGKAAQALVNLIEDVQAPLSADFAKWALADGVVRIDGEDVVTLLPTVRSPAIFFAGAADQIALPKAVRVAFEAWGKEGDVDKRYVLMGREGGCVHDYGHGDLAIGDNLADELFLPLGEFLSRS
jgi:polyhydroxyalkanoate synthase